MVRCNCICLVECVSWRRRSSYSVGCAPYLVFCEAPQYLVLFESPLHLVVFSRFEVEICQRGLIVMTSCVDRFEERDHLVCLREGLPLGRRRTHIRIFHCIEELRNDAEKLTMSRYRLEVTQAVSL